ncbi:MAG: hypothetical protein ACRD3M_01895, partial [Thermoanaerobaculia bacterium]
EYEYPLEGQDPENPIDVGRYNRTESAALAGLRLRLTSSLDMTAGVQGTRSEFVELPELRDNETYAILGGIHFDRPKFFLNLAGGYRKGYALNNSLYDYQTPVGSYFLSWFVGGPVELQAFGHRRPGYSRSALDQLYFELRYGGGVRLRLGSRVSLGGHAEAGTNSYPFSVSADGGERVDDAWSYGGDLSVRVLDRVVLRANALQTVRRPPDPGVERKVFRFWTGLSFNGEFTRE